MSSKHPPAWPVSSVRHPSWHASHLLTTVSNAYYYFSTVPDLCPLLTSRPWPFHFFTLSWEAYFKETSLGRTLYTYHSITIRSIIPYHPHHLNIPVELTFLRTVYVSTINTNNLQECNSLSTFQTTFVNTDFSAVAFGHSLGKMFPMFFCHYNTQYIQLLFQPGKQAAQHCLQYTTASPSLWLIDLSSVQLNFNVLYQISQ